MADTYKHSGAVERETMEPDGFYTLWDRGPSGYWSIDRTYGGAYVKGDDAWGVYLDERSRSTRPAAFFPRGIDPNQQQKGGVR